MNFEGGLYLHVPFCKQACHYCNFHFATSLTHKSRLLDAMKLEIVRQASQFERPELKTIYLGGGSPSILTIQDLDSLFEVIHKYFRTDEVQEITLEANPDDLNVEYLSGLKGLGIHRLSIGIQSFFDEDLKWMNRAHDSRQALRCVPMAMDAGFDALSVDLIFGFPLLSDDKYIFNLNTIIDWQVPHISAYSLTVEEKTPLFKSIKKGIDVKPEEGKNVKQFELTHDILVQRGYDQYEVSNYAKPDKYAVHNSNYWLGIPYLGIGPAAHSYYNNRRFWNVANNQQYIRFVEANENAFTYEEITPEIAYNELMLTRLRTIWGVSLDEIRHINSIYVPYFQRKIKPMIDLGIVDQNGESFKLTYKGKLMADYWTTELFL